jgi:hypothetical protein
MFNYYKLIIFILNIGDWGLGIEDWAQSPIPNPHHIYLKKFLFINFYEIIFLIH